MVHAHDLLSEITFTASRSGGPGGQNVNKVSSKITLRFSIVDSSILSEEQKQTLLHKLSGYLSKDGVLQIISQDNRSQLINKEQALVKLSEMCIRDRAFAVRKKRKPTKPTKASKQKRITDKKQRSEKKQWRQKF